MEKVDWRFTMDFLFPPECLKIPNFLVFLCMVITYYIIFTVGMTGLFQYHQFVERDSPIISALKVFSLAIGIILGSITYSDSFVVKTGTRWFMITTSATSLGTSIWITRINFTITNSYFKFEMIPFFLLGLAVNYFFDVFLNSVMACTPMHLQGSVAGIYFTAGQVGVALGDAIFTSVAGELGVANSFEEKKELHKNIVNGLYVGVAACALAFISSLFTVDTDSMRAKEKPEVSDSGESSEADDLEKQPNKSGLAGQTQLQVE
ncbi:unnamed protein product [Ambrosiozyma monospora]|uniref:Unnamed protein product n=1 Tax=Ambrosiozyma monospora TaxID=43982 RepID=A0ACB5U8M7_AMBMO|nr:unnamed protein product [Ambrosiozyma monospora]